MNLFTARQVVANTVTQARGQMARWLETVAMCMLDFTLLTIRRSNRCRDGIFIAGRCNLRDDM